MKCELIAADDDRKIIVIPDEKPIFMTIIEEGTRMGFVFEFEEGIGKQALSAFGDVTESRRTYRLLDTIEIPEGFVALARKLALANERLLKFSSPLRDTNVLEDQPTESEYESEKRFKDLIGALISNKEGLH